MSRLIGLFSILAVTTFGCATATYTLEDTTALLPNGQPKPLRPGVSADAPGGDTFAIVVYYGKTAPLGFKAGADATALVNATAAAGSAAVKLALKASRL